MVKYKFEILRGCHRKGAVRDKQGKVVTPGVNLVPGDIIETDTDLIKKFVSDPPRFRRIDIVQEVEKDLESTLRNMSIPQLRKKAAKEEIDIDGCNTKEEILTAFLNQTV
jgi:hypothetical protein